MTTQHRGTIIKTPDSSPGLLVVEGQQKTFTLEGVWKSPIAPAVNMAVDIEFDGVGSITGLTVADSQQAAREKFGQIGGVAQQHGKEAAEIARQGVGPLVARMGKVTLVATVIVWITWFFMPGAGFSISFLGTGQTKSFTLWDALSLDPKNNMNPGPFGLLNLVVIAGILAPIAASFIRQRWARYLYAAPLACLLVAWIAIEYDFSEAVAGAGIAARMTGIQLVPEYGTFLAALASVVVAVRVLRRKASASATSVAKPPTSGVPFSANGFCTNCGQPRSPGASFCTECGSQHASAAAI